MKNSGTDKAFEEGLKRHLEARRILPAGSENCPDENAVSAYLEGQLPSGLQTQMQLHFSHCQRCQKELAILLRGRNLQSPAEESKSDAVGLPWHESILGFLQGARSWGLKPAIAILLVTVVSGYVGYEMLRQSPRQISVELDRTLSGPRDSLSRDEKREMPIEKNVVQTPKESTVASEAPPGATFPETSMPNQPGSKVEPPGGYGTLRKKEELPKQGMPSLTGPEVFQEQARALKDAGPENAPADRERGALGGVVSAPAGPVQAETPRESDSRQAKQKSAELGPAVSAQSAGTVSESKIAIPADSVTSSAKAVSPRTAMVQSKLSARTDEKASASKPDNMLAGVELDRGNEPIYSQPAEWSRIEVAGRLFEFSKSAWRDLSILHNGSRPVVVLYRNSPDFEKHAKRLSAFRELLSRPQDFVVLHNGKVYWVKSQNSPPDSK